MALQNIAVLKSDINANSIEEQKYSIQRHSNTSLNKTNSNMDETKKLTNASCGEVTGTENLVKKLVENFESKLLNKKEEDKLSTKKNRPTFQRCNFERKSNVVSDNENPISRSRNCANVINPEINVLVAPEPQKQQQQQQGISLNKIQNNNEVVNKKVSFRDMLNFVIGQRRQQQHDETKTRRFRSCVELNGSEEQQQQYIYIPRVRTVQTENKENKAQDTNRYATIRPIYGGRKHRKLILTKSLENFTVRTFPTSDERNSCYDGSSPGDPFYIRESSENLVKPLTVKNITGRLSQQDSGQVCNRKNKELEGGGEVREEISDCTYDTPTKRSNEEALTSRNKREILYENIHTNLPAVSKSTKDAFLRRRERRARAYKEYCKDFLPSSYEKRKIRRRWIPNLFN